jgi:hypothetical protein
MVSSLFAFLIAVMATPPTAPPPPNLTPPIVRTPTGRPPMTPSAAIFRGMVKLAPHEAVMKAADAAPRPVYGVFELRVSRAEQVGPNYFLNSEKDYRDQRNLSISIGPRALATLRTKHGDDLRAALMGKTIRVLGSARRVKVDFYSYGKRTDKYYFQTHVPIADARQIEIAS